MHLLAVFFLLLAQGRAVSAEPLWSGYYENQLSGEWRKGALSLLDYNKLRVDLESGVGEEASVTADFIYRTFHGTVEVDPFLFLPAGVAFEVPDSSRPYYRYRFVDETELDNAYLSVSRGRLTFRLGKQQLPWGTGYAWNPTDVLNKKNALDPTYEKPGINAVRFSLDFGSAGELDAVFLPGEDFRASGKVVRLSERLGGFDFSLTAGRIKETGNDYAALGGWVRTRTLLGGDFSGQVLGVGVWGEGAWNGVSMAGGTPRELGREVGRDFDELLLGADYTLENGFYAMIEYFRYGPGETRKENYSFQDWMSFVESEAEGLGRDYAFVGGSYPAGRLLELSGYFLANLNDRSGVALPWINYSVSDAAELDLVFLFPFGSSGSEYGQFSNGGFLRLRVYY